MEMTYDQLKARIAELEGRIANPPGIPFSRHDPDCRLPETGRYAAKCGRCQRLKERKTRKAAAQRILAKQALHPQSKGQSNRERKSESVFTVSGGLPSLGKGSR